ncbi:Ribosomal protein S13A, putative [Theobroma cacao]|uniref:Ribosomal protein S13A, putative n=1 Tax=Theobroma cacao TaxID=3641 RepID=A0A061G5J8_THECC|nr:Ribosomal protein S13A, putative [Theobroma cacao]
MTPSQIGVTLRDSHGIAQVKSVTGSKILRILKAHGLAPEIPEDLYHLIKKAVAIRKHLESNRKDKDSKFRLILVESRIHRLARYYKKTKKLPPRVNHGKHSGCLEKVLELWTGGLSCPDFTKKGGLRILFAVTYTKQLATTECYHHWTKLNIKSNGGPVRLQLESKGADFIYFCTSKEPKTRSAGQDNSSK